MSLTKLQKVRNVVNKIEYTRFKDWEIRVIQLGTTIYLYVNSFDWVGRMHMVASDYTDEQIVGLAFEALQAAEIHELRQNFKYNGKTIFGSVIDLETLEKAADQAAYKKHLDKMSTGI